MRIFTIVATAGALLAVALAGCISAEDTPSTTDTDEGLPDQSAEAKATEDTGSLKGTVGSDLFEPIGGATVTIIETVETDDPKETKTAKDGSFTINGVLPGRYTVWTSAPGYESKRLPVDIEVGAVAELQFLLAPVKCDDCPYEDVREYAGKINAAASWQVEPPGVGCIIIDSPAIWDPKTCSGIRFGGENGEVKIEVPERAHTIFAAMTWDPAGPLGENLHLDLLCEEVPRGSGGAVLDTEHPCYWDTPSQTSPIIHRVDKEHWETEGYNHTGNWSARVFGTYGMLGTYEYTGTDVGAAYEQTFKLYTEVWVNHPAPPDYLPVPDA